MLHIRRVSILVKLLVLLIVAAAVFGGGAYFAYELFVKPEKLDRVEAEEIAQREETEPTPTPDFTIPIYEELEKAIAGADPVVEQEALRDFLLQHPQSSKAGEAKDRLGELNMRMIFTSMDAPGKIDYTVVSGDSLVRIASRNNSNAELIMRANNLLSIDLQIGQQLRIPQINPSIVVDREARTLTLFDEGKFLKEYALVSFTGPGSGAGTPIDATVSDKVAIRGSERVAFGGGNFVGSDRWLMLSGGGPVIRGFREFDEDGNPNSKAAGILVSQEAIEEIFPLVTRGTPVNIR